jgi:hypothetical protein
MNPEQKGSLGISPQSYLKCVLHIFPPAILSFIPFYLCKFPSAVSSRELKIHCAPRVPGLIQDGLLYF